MANVGESSQEHVGATPVVATPVASPITPAPPPEVELPANLLIPGLTAEQLVRILQAATAESRRTEVIKLPDPEKYYGRNMKEHIEWTRYLDKYFANKARTFPTEQDKVTFASAYLRGNIEAAWSRLEPNLDLATYTWSQLKEFLLDEIEDPQNRGWTAALKFTELQQGAQQSVQSFMATFQERVNEVASEKSKDDELLWVRFFFAKLRPDIRKQIQNYQNPPNKLSELCALATRIEQLSKSRDNPTIRPHRDSSNPQQQTDRGGFGKPNQSFSGSPHKRKNDETTTESNKRQRTSPQYDKEVQKREGRCFKCNERGHRIGNCPNDVSNGPNKDSNRGTANSGGKNQPQ
jgi:hypothetical protein